MSLKRLFLSYILLFIFFFFLSDSVVSVVIVPVSKDKAVTVNNSNNYHPAAPQKYVSLYVLKRVKLNKIFHQTSAGQFGLKSNLKIKSQKA